MDTASAIILALIRRLVMTGLLDAGDVDAISMELKAEGHPDAALAVAAVYIEALIALGPDEPPAPHLRLVADGATSDS